MNEQTVSRYLEYFNKDTVTEIARAFGVKRNKIDKTTMINNIDAFLSDDRNIEAIWNSLSPYEKEYLEEFIKYSEKPGYMKRMELQKKYDLQKVNQDYPLLDAFTHFNPMPVSLKKSLSKYLTPIEIKYDIFDIIEDSPEGGVFCYNLIAENFAIDFVHVIELAHNVKLDLTRKGLMPTKSTALKIDSVLLNKDFVFHSIDGIKGIRSINDTNRIYGIYMILFSSSLLSYSYDYLNLIANQTTAFHSMKVDEKCKHLLNHYIKSTYINELGRIVESDFITQKNGYLRDCRKIILKHLRNCPVNKWLSTAQLIDYIKIADKDFLRAQVGKIIHFSDKHKEYFEPWVEWEDIEGRFIEVVLQEYLSVLGIVDTVIREDEGGCWDYESKPFFKVHCFRITPLGAFVLGMTEEYHHEEKVMESGFTVSAENGLRIEIKDGPGNRLYMMFFDRFIKAEIKDDVYIYPLTFNTLVKAMDDGITIDDILEYIHTKSLNAIPETFLAKMNKWKKDMDRVVIKNITVVQTDDKELADELSQTSGIKKLIKNDLSNMFEIDTDSVKKVKKEIEKKGYYCKLE